MIMKGVEVSQSIGIIMLIVVILVLVVIATQATNVGEDFALRQAISLKCRDWITVGCDQSSASTIKADEENNWSLQLICEKVYTESNWLAGCQQQCGCG